MRGVPPLGVPAVIQLAFWGGVWGIAFVLVERVIARCPGGYWLGAVLFGAIVPTLVFWFVVLPLKGLPVGYGFHFPGIAVALIVNGLWGLGTGVFLRLLPGATSRLQIIYRIAAVIAAPRSLVPALPPRSGVRVPPSASTSAIARSTAAAAAVSPKCVEHHRARPDLADRVGDAAPGDVGRRAVHRLEHRRDIRARG